MKRRGGEGGLSGDCVHLKCAGGAQRVGWWGGSGQENGCVAGTAPGPADRRFDNTVVRSPELLAAEGGGK